MSLLRLVPVVLCMGTIFILSNQPGDVLSLSLFPGEDKVAHVIAYAVLAATILYAFPPCVRNSKKGLVWTVVLLVAFGYGFSDEFHQSFIDGRTSSYADLAADFTGALLTCLIWSEVGRRYVEKGSRL